MKCKTFLSVAILCIMVAVPTGLSAESGKFTIDKLHIYPNSPKLLSPGDKVKISFNYQNDYDTKVAVHILPYSGEELTEKYKSSKAKNCAPGEGRVKGFFTTKAKRTQINALVIRVTPTDDHSEVLWEKSITVKYTYRENRPF